METDTIIAVFQKVARPVMLRYLGERQTCVAATRITIETMKVLSLDAEPVAVQLVAECKELKYAYISGFSKEERRKMAKQNRKPILTRGQKDGYNGHVIAAVEGRWLIDSSIDQIESVEHGLSVPPTVLVMPLPDDKKLDLKQMSLDMSGVSDDGHKLRLRYSSHWDYSFVNSDAWEFCIAMKLVVAHIVAAMTEACEVCQPL